MSVDRIRESQITKTKIPHIPRRGMTTQGMTPEIEPWDAVTISRIETGESGEVLVTYYNAPVVSTGSGWMVNLGFPVVACWEEINARKT